MPYVPQPDRPDLDVIAEQAAAKIAQTSQKYGYCGAFAGEMNYFLTRLIQHLGRHLSRTHEMPNELKYTFMASVYGVLLDVAMEHKVRVNRAYEVAQIIKSGDCFDTPYLSKPVAVVDENGHLLGYMTVHGEKQDLGEFADRAVIDGEVVVRRP